MPRKQKPKPWRGVCVDTVGKKKRCFTSKIAAKRAAIGVLVSGDSTRGERAPIEEYRCKRCGFFHLGHPLKSVES